MSHVALREALRDGAGRQVRCQALPHGMDLVVGVRSEEAAAAADEAVLKAGYRTNSSHFRTQVNVVLIKGGCKRMGRGKYATA